MYTWKSFIKNKKNVVILLLSMLCALKIPQGGWGFILWITGGVLTCGVVDTLLNKVFRHKKISVQSAVITGFIVAGILDYSLDWYWVVVFSAIAILSKFIIRIKKNHVFNPATFALLVATLCRQPLTWNIESNSYLVIIAGMYLVFSLRKWPHVLGFLLVFSSTFYLSGVNPLNMISWFFVFIMLIEPKTSGFGVWKGFSFGGIVGITSFIMFTFMPQIDIFIAALALANIFNVIAKKVKVGTHHSRGVKK